MKAQIKYSFLAGSYIRGPVFAVIFVMNTVFIIIGSAGSLPFAASVTAVSLGGIAIAVMMAANIIGDIAIARRMFSPPGAYLYALTPVPRWKTLLASIINMTLMDSVTMTFVILTQVILSFNLTGLEWDMAGIFLAQDPSWFFYLVWGILFILAAYLLTLSIILFCMTARKSILDNLPAAGFLAVLMAFGCIYSVSLLQLVLAPFSIVERYGIFIILSLNNQAALVIHVLLILFSAALLFVLTSKFMEKRMNI